MAFVSPAQIAPQRIVGARGKTRAPFGAGIESDLTDRVDNRRTSAEHDSVVAVEPTRAVRLIGLREDGGAGRRLREDEHITRGDGPDEVDGQAGSRAAVEEHLDVVAVPAEIDRRTGAVVDLDRFVVARPFDVLGDEQLGSLG
jgi:hypothetical protein